MRTVLFAPFLKILQDAQNFWGIGIRNHGRPWACEREGPVTKKMLWKMGVTHVFQSVLLGMGGIAPQGA